MREDRRQVGASARLPVMRQHVVLRQLAEQARTKHAHASGHPVIASAEPGERWMYCYPDDAFAEY
jgi:hypothetical protein